MAGVSIERQGSVTVSNEIEAAARELVAWFTSGNSVPVDIRYVVKVSGDKIMNDVDRLNKALGKGNGS